MKQLTYAVLSVVQTLLRVLPFPCRTGLIRIGNPGRNAPVLLTGNFRLTAQRVQRALEGLDVYLLVANSRGFNVWCAATGGHLTNHDVVSVLKTSGIEEQVDHRQVILPQLAATGIEGRVVHQKTGWRVQWGPVYATDIPQYLGRNGEKTPDMRRVRFPWLQRLEMAVAWAFPISLLTLLVWPFWQEGVLPLAAFVWIAAMALFLAFPLYQSRLQRKEKNVGFIFFDFGKHAVPLILWLVFMAGLVFYSLATGDFAWELLMRWGLSSLVVLMMLGLDLMGSTPMFKSGLHADRLLAIEIDAERCKGAGFCEQVCPTHVFTVDRDQQMAFLTGAERCVQCGACVVQCPFDALHFRTPGGDQVPPETIRRFKLNLIGNRAVDASPHDRD